MARPRRCRRICSEPLFRHFGPADSAGQESIALTVDEYEAIRLIDLEKQTHEQCARQMEVSRTTVTGIYEAAREKIADSIVNGRPLLICGGDYRLCAGRAGLCCGKTCVRNRADFLFPARRKGEHEMRIAVTYENGNIYQHFGHTEQFKIYDAENGQIVQEQIANTNGQGHGALAGFLTAMKADVLICGGIGGGAQTALAEAGIQLCGGVSGSADEAVTAFLAGRLNFDPQARCSHHEQGHSCSEHTCREEKHGCQGNEK